MAKEIEKKFLIKYPEIIVSAKHSTIVQAYIHVDKEKQIRVRKISSLTGTEYTMCIKYMGVVRDEFEGVIPAETGEALINKCQHKFIKRRQSYQRNGLHYDIDRYNNGLIICEVEFPDEESLKSFNKPVFLGKCVDGEHIYCNYYFAGIPENQYK